MGIKCPCSWEQSPPPPRPLSVQRFGTAELLGCVEGDPGLLGAEGRGRGGLGGEDE